ncbi:M20/M25/M40 family metallo-hydrolase [Actinoplanes sp. TBRC 11911]|uniref:M20 family metallopeptidase n=1 Tax=Actinoplanes sp. TBRC 11911 TaxID=2729386 RepID=UPI00145F945C|nr:M20/M25/M40 family metallo-hydrolase [Actinoplanes sp. TBRC 11911]NMO56623.1 M20/M25/M40 family metallo-hydrolase [Actinoplanes sp. TBRC 11911]
MSSYEDRLAALVAIPSTSDRPADLARALDFVLAEIGTDFPVRRYSSNGKPSALVHAGDGPFRVILNAHLDVVPGAPAQFAARRDGDRLYGRGTQDMKAAALAMVDAFRATAGTLGYPVALQLVTDEEVGGFDGTAHQIAAGVRAGFVVIGEYSDLRVVTASKGICMAMLTASGSAAHAAYPWLGSNALLTLIAGIDRLMRRYPVPAAEAWTTTVNVARVETPNTATNQVPASATAFLDIRFPPGDTDFHGRTPSQVADHLSAVAGLPAEVAALGQPHETSPDNPLLASLRAALTGAGGPGTTMRKHGASDSRHYHAAGVDTVICGPGGNGQHGPDEYVDLTSVEAYRNALIAFLRSS